MCVYAYVHTYYSKTEIAVRLNIEMASFTQRTDSLITICVYNWVYHEGAIDCISEST